MRVPSGPDWHERSEAEKNKRVVIRDRDYYGGNIYVTHFPVMEMDLVELEIVWEAYQGGRVMIRLQSEEELRKLAAVLIEAAETVKDDGA